MLELAQTCIQVTGSRSEIVFEALPVDDPQVRRPDITRARQILGWEPEVDLEEGLGAGSRRSARSRSRSEPGAVGSTEARSRKIGTEASAPGRPGAPPATTRL